MYLAVGKLGSGRTQGDVIAGVDGKRVRKVRVGLGWVVFSCVIGGWGKRVRVFLKQMFFLWSFFLKKSMKN